MSTIAMLVVPFGLFYLVANNQYLLEQYGHEKRQAIAAIAAVGGVQLVIYTVIIIKYYEDFVAVAKGEGHIPYDETQ